MKITYFNILLFGLVILFSYQCAPTSSKEEGLAKKVNFTASSYQVTDLKIATLSTMLANRGIGEWGYSAIVEVDGRKLLFDTGQRPETVLKNAEELGFDLHEIEDVFLSHNHGDHTGGLLSLREKLKTLNPKAMSRVHVGEGIFAQRINAGHRMQDMKEKLEADGVEFIVYDKPTELFPGVWITGPVERIHDEKNYGQGGRIYTEAGEIVDNIPEDQSLAINTEKGFVVVAGCGHAGIINTLDYVKSKIEDKKIFAVVGGFHLVSASDEHLDWTAQQLKRVGVEKIIGAHCTGLHALYSLKESLALSRENAVVGSVGDYFDLKDGIHAGIIAR